MKGVSKVSILPDADSCVPSGVDKVIDLVTSRDDSLIVMQLKKKEALTLKKNLDIAIERVWGIK